MTKRWLIILMVLAGPLGLRAEKPSASDATAKTADPTPTTQPAAKKPAPERGDRPGPADAGRRQRPGGKRGRWGAMGDRPNLSDDEQAKTLEFVLKHMPDMHARLMRIKTADPTRYRRMLAGIHRNIQPVLEMPEAIREAYFRQTQLRIDLFKATAAYRKAQTTEQKDTLKKQVRALLAKQFDVEQTIRNYRLQQLEKQLDRLREELKQDKARRDAIIDGRLDRYLSDDGPPPRPERDGPRNRPDRPGPPGRRNRADRPARADGPPP